MNEVTSHVSDLTKVNLMEVNNNFPIKKSRKESQVSISSVSSYQSDSSEESQSRLDEKSFQEIGDIIEEAEDLKILAEFRRGRSISDGAVIKLTDSDHTFEVFPSLPNSVLEKMGLYGDGPRERMTEEEVEQKFIGLALAFKIDATTIKDRYERQRRYRDQTEANLSTEIERLKDKLALIQPLCTDYETANLLSTLLTQVDIVMKAASLVTISSERYGSVQHEQRLAESVLVMINHVQMLKQQRDSARSQLKYTKQVLQNPLDSPVSSPTNPHNKSSLPSTTRKLIYRRRASIATFSQPLLDNKILVDKKVVRRASDLSLRASSLTRNIRPSRLEFGGDLVKISEGFAYEPVAIIDQKYQEENENPVTETNSDDAKTEETENPIVLQPLLIRDTIKHNVKKLELQENYKKLVNNGTIHEICCFCALLCFSISLLAMVNILAEYEYAKRGWLTSQSSLS